jgi:tetratricopeptide (TPR) repeat protein
MIRVSPIVDNVVNPALRLVGIALRGFQFLVIVVALMVAVLKAGPDFDRVETRRVAKLKKGLQFPASYHGEAQRAAKRGEWATAVLHWQRAAANAPANRQFQRQLGIAYARLGFYERSADVLQSALRITPDPEQQAQINRLLTTVQKHLNTKNE